MPSLIRRFHSWLGGLLGATKSVAPHASSAGASVQIEHESDQSLVPYDENLLERSRTQWQFGDWESLAKLERDTRPSPRRFRLNRKTNRSIPMAVSP